MRKIIRPSSISRALLGETNIRNPVRVQTFGWNIFDIFKTESGYSVNNVTQGSTVSFGTIKELKYFMSLYN